MGERFCDLYGFWLLALIRHMSFLHFFFKKNIKTNAYFVLCKKQMFIIRLRKEIYVNVYLSVVFIFSPYHLFLSISFSKSHNFYAARRTRRHFIRRVNSTHEWRLRAISMIIETHLWSFRQEKCSSRDKAASPEDGDSILIAGKYGNPRAKRESSANDYSRAARSRRTMEIGSRNEILSSN